MAIESPISAAELQIGARILLVRGRRVMLDSDLAELEQRVSSHDDALGEIRSALRQLVEPDDSESEKRELGFHVKNSRTKNLVLR